MSEDQKQILERQLWAVANTLRGRMNADEYKVYILGFIFYKYLSEKLAMYVDEKLLSREDYTYTDIDPNSKDGKEHLATVKELALEHLGFFLGPQELFSYLVAKGKGETKAENTFILEDLQSVLNTIESTAMGTDSEDDFKGLFADIELSSNKLGKSEKDKNDTVVEVLSHLAGIDFKLADSKSDLLGDAYEYLIGEFAAGAGKKGGEFYTPAQVSRLLARIVTDGKKTLRSAYDPTCGSGSLLLRLGDYASIKSYYGQELNTTTHSLARMNMILHDIRFDRFDIRQGDTLRDDQHPDMQAEAIVANPPFSAKWKGDIDPVLAQDDRFAQYGRLAPKGAADYAFVAHMIHHLADNGTMAVVLPHGALFRSGAEGTIRQHIIEKQNYLDAVIGLPANIFYGTSIPATILVFKKCRKEDEDILFIDGSSGFIKVNNQNHLTDEDVQKIFTVYKKREEVAKFSHKATLEEIKENDYNLNIARYVDTLEPEPEVDIDAVVKELHELTAGEQDIQNRIAGFCKELGIIKPF